MEYRIQPNDTLATIAANLTLSGAYGVALGNLNGLYSDVNPDGSTIPFDVNTSLSAYGLQTLTIPDTWLRPGVTAGNAVQVATGGVTLPAIAGGAALPAWVPLVFIAAIVLMG